MRICAEQLLQVEVLVQCFVWCVHKHVLCFRVGFPRWRTSNGWEAAALFCGALWLRLSLRVFLSLFDGAVPLSVFYFCQFAFTFPKFGFSSLLLLTDPFSCCFLLLLSRWTLTLKNFFFHPPTLHPLPTFLLSTTSSSFRDSHIARPVHRPPTWVAKN